MAMVRNVVSCLAVAAVLMTMANATSYTVGDADGWSFVVDYTVWVSGKSFKVGDELVFDYLPNHDVLEVSKPDYDLCIASSPIKSYNGGSTTITLTAAGNRYFICGTPGHCDQGQKLAVETLGSSSSPPPPTATSPPPPTPATPPPAAQPPVETPTTSFTPESSPPTAFTPESSPPSITPAHSPKTSSPKFAPTVSPPPPVESPTSTPKADAPPPKVSKVAPTPQHSSAYKVSYGSIFALALMMLAAI